MKYSEILGRVSNEIYDLDNSLDSDISFITENTQENLGIYKRNLLGGLINSFSQDFNVTLKYLGFNNFRFFVKQFLVGHKITDHNIFASSYGFRDFIKDNFEVHQNDLLEYLSELDLFWNQYESNPNENGIKLPKGMALYWSALLNDTSCDNIEVDFNFTEIIKVDYRDDEAVLVIGAKQVND